MESEKMAVSIAVGKDGRLYIVDSQDKIWYSPINPKKQICRKAKAKPEPVALVPAEIGVPALEPEVAEKKLIDHGEIIDEPEQP